MPLSRFVLTRRAAMAGGAVAAASLIGAGRIISSARAANAGLLRETRIGGMAVTLTAQAHDIHLPGRTGATPAWLYEQELFPVFRLRLGERLDVTLKNALYEHTSVHWHGIRGPNAMDGVAYVTQEPVKPGETFRYSFTPPDAGTFFFHPHCNTAEQLGRGLVGILIVEDPNDAYDADIVCVLKDWRVKEDGSFLPFVTLEGAGRGGTFGTLRTANGLASPEIAVPASGKIRLRIVNVDSTRVGEIGLDGAEMRLIAVDGNRLSPIMLDSWRLGPAMRMDLEVEAPEAGGRVKLVDYFAREPVTLATLVADGAAKAQPRNTFARAGASKLPEPDLSKAQRHELKLSESAQATDYSGVAPIVLPDGSRIDLLDTLCSNARTLWALDGKTWPQNGHQHLPPPLMTFKKGETALIEFANTTPHVHPMHLHGHSFKVLSASKLKRPVHWADTVLVMPEERVQIAFVADNPGNWMIHCHIIEHQDTGMMGWFRVV